MHRAAAVMDRKAPWMIATEFKIFIIAPETAS